MDQNITSLNLPKNKIAELKKLGYSYCKDVESDLEKHGLEELPSLRQAPETKTAFNLLEEEILHGCILSYNEGLDNILKDIIVPKTITELSGLPGSGKTQLCFQLCISVQLPITCGGVGGESLYISTNFNFASHRVRELAKTFIDRYNKLKSKIKIPEVEFTEEYILEHIHYIQVSDSLELIACITLLENYLPLKNIRLIVIDSISYPLRLVDGEKRTLVISKIFQSLQALASTYNFAVVLTNDFTTRVAEGKAYETPSFGDSFYHLVNSRIILSKKNSAFHGKLVKSVLYGEKESSFYL